MKKTPSWEDIQHELNTNPQLRQLSQRFMVRHSQTRYVDFTKEQGMVCAGCATEAPNEASTIIQFEIQANAQPPITRHRFAFWLCPACHHKHDNPATQAQIELHCVHYWLQRVTGQGFDFSHKHNA